MKKKNRIKKYLEFKEIIDLKHSKRNEFGFLYFRTNEYGFTRIGVQVSKKHGNAVMRNKIKRQVRNILDSFLNYSESLDLIIIPSRNYNVNEFEKFKEALIRLLTSLKE
ncbi:MAG TPA: ribonuclease P protein component [Candidatus Onthovivens sp.]|nr:ribonuclease P protein component [Candidatus Onthovivens sp.]